MEINSDLKEKLGKYRECPGYVWPYIKEYFNNSESEFTKFLDGLDSGNAKKFLHALFFYWAHNPLRKMSEDQKSPNFDVFVYILTLSIVEFLMQDVSKNPWHRVERFFRDNLEDGEGQFLDCQIKARKGGVFLDRAAVRILYDMRNNFIHQAEAFPLISQDGAEFASVKYVVSPSGNEEDSYLADVRIRLRDYLDIFWKCYFRFFGLEA